MPNVIKCENCGAVIGTVPISEFIEHSRSSHERISQ
jgi:hypothetical protein